MNRDWVGNLWHWLGDAWDWLDTNADGLVALFTLFAVIVAVRTLNSSKADSEERSRPVVTGELRTLQVHGAVALVVANRGATPAHDVRVTFDPPLADIPEEKRSSSIMWQVVRRYAKPIAMLAPGQELSNVYRAIGDDIDKGPDRTTMAVEYRGHRRKRHRETYVLDLESLMSETVITNSKSLEAQTVEGVKHLKTIAGVMQAMNTAGVKLREPQSAEDRQREEQHNDLVRALLGRTPAEVQISEAGESEQPTQPLPGTRRARQPQPPPS